MKKRFLSLLLVLCMAGSLVGCGGESSTPAAPEEPPAPVEDEDDDDPFADTPPAAPAEDDGGATRIINMNDLQFGRNYPRG